MCCTQARTILNHFLAGFLVAISLDASRGFTVSLSPHHWFELRPSELPCSLRVYSFPLHVALQELKVSRCPTACVCLLEMTYGKDWPVHEAANLLEHSDAMFVSKEGTTGQESCKTLSNVLSNSDGQMASSTAGGHVQTPELEPGPSFLPAP